MTSARRLLLIPALLLLALPGPAAASQQSVRASSAGKDYVEYRLHISGRRIAAASLRGRARTRHIGVRAIRNGLRGSRLRLTLSRSVRRRVGARPRVVLKLRRAASRAPKRLINPIPPERGPVSARCTKYASPSGVDSAAGTLSAPYRSAQRLADSLRAGAVGCLKNGVYDQETLSLRYGGTRSNRVVLRSAPGHRALVKGQIWVMNGANFVTVAHLNHTDTLNTSLVRPSPIVNGDDALFYDLDVSRANAPCFYIGDAEWGIAERTTLRRNRIHNCGRPGSNKRHGIYLARGVDTKIKQNWIYDNPDRGIQLYPNSTGAVIRGNVIDGNGEGILFSGDRGEASRGNRVEGNLITNSRLRHDVESWYPNGNPIGQNNVVRSNCVFGGKFGGIEAPQRGFKATANFTRNPGYVGRARRDYRIPAAGGCAATLRAAGGS